MSNWEAKLPSTLDPPTQAHLRSAGVTTQTIEKTVCYVINTWNSKNTSGHWIGRDGWDGRSSGPRRFENDFQTYTVCTRSKHWDREAEFSWPLLLLLVFVSSVALVQYKEKECGVYVRRSGWIVNRLHLVGYQAQQRHFWLKLRLSQTRL